jgi:phosphatidylglycerol---prolipoprotein diacylglyceryl transferase
MNGCCFGGICEETNLPSIRFPSGSPPYMAQLESGRLLGIRWRSDSEVTSQAERIDRVHKTIDRVEPESWAWEKGFMARDKIVGADEIYVQPPPADRDPAGPSQIVLGWQNVSATQRSLDGSGGIERGRSEKQEFWFDVPNVSLPTHPSQIYAAISALFLAGFTFCLWPNLRSDGTVLGVGFVTYGVSRILEEFIRVDEAGQFGTSLSISQWISLVGLSIGVTILLWKRPPKSNTLEIEQK